jgi:hypothetical protein
MPGLLIIHINFLAGVLSKNAGQLIFPGENQPPLVD